VRIEVSCRQNQRSQKTGLKREDEATVHHLQPISELQPQPTCNQNSKRNQNQAAKNIDGPNVPFHKLNTSGGKSKPSRNQKKWNSNSQ
jgi:hypothetical protein